MPDTATIDAPETTTTPQQPLTAPIHPDLQALMERVLPIDGDAAGKVTPAPEPSAPETATTTAPAKTATDAPTAPEKPDKTTLRLAPDLTVPEKKEPPAAESAVAQVEKEMPETPPEEVKTPKARENYKRWRETNLTLARQVDQLKAAPPAKSDDPGAQAIIDRQNQQLAELSVRLERQNLREHPIFQERYIQPRQRMAGEAAEVVKLAGGDPEALERALSLVGKSRIAAFDDIVKDVESPVLRAKLERLIDGIDTKDGEIAAALKDSKGLSDKLGQEEKIARHEMLARQEQQLKSLLGAATRDLADNLKLEVLQKTGKPDFKWWDDQVDEIRATSEEILLKATPDKMAIASVLAAAAGPLRSMWQSERKARLAAEARLAEIEDAEPDLKDRRQPKPPEGEFAPDADITQVAMARLRRGDFNTAK